jgi:aldose 1-epimerase
VETTTTIENVSHSAMPVMIAFHPYFRPDGGREDWTLSVGATKHWRLTPKLTATGENEPTENFLPKRKDLTLGKTFLDDLFSDLERGSDGLGRVTVKGKTQKIEVVYGKEFDFAVIYAPLDRTLICIEPQTAPTNAFNLNHQGKYPGLFVLEAGKTFSARFWIIPTGF